MTIDTLDEEIGKMSKTSYDNLTEIKRKIECLIPKIFHNKNILGTSLFRQYYTKYIEEVNYEKFKIYLKEAESIEEKFLKYIKNTYLKILEINGCVCNSEKVQELINGCDISNRFEQWSKIKNLCFPKKDLSQIVSTLSPKPK